MKSKELLAKKNLSTQELSAELRGTREKLFTLKFKHRSGSLANPLELRGLRRHAARLETWLSERRRAQEAR